MSPICGIAVATALLATIASTLSVYPHQLAYFNEAAGGPENGHKHLLHSNLDWGQDLLFLRHWVREFDTDSQLLGAIVEAPCKHPALGITALSLPDWLLLIEQRGDALSQRDYLVVSITRHESSLLVGHEPWEQSEPKVLDLGKVVANMRTIDRVGYSLLVLQQNSTHSPRN